MTKHGETLEQVQQVIDNGPPLSVQDLALHLGYSYAGARRVAELLVKSGKIGRTKTSGGMVVYGRSRPDPAPLAEQRAAWLLVDNLCMFGLERPKKSLWSRFMEWMRK